MVFRVGGHEAEHLVRPQAAEVHVGQLSLSLRPGPGEALFEAKGVGAQGLEHRLLGTRLVGGRISRGARAFGKRPSFRIWGRTRKRSRVRFQKVRRRRGGSPTPSSSFNKRS